MLTSLRLIPIVFVAFACSSGSALPTSPGDEIQPADTTAPDDPSLSYEFGAKLEPPLGRVVHGMGQWVNGNPQYMAMLPASNQPASELMFMTLGDTPRPWDPSEIAADSVMECADL